MFLYLQLYNAYKIMKRLDYSINLHSFKTNKISNNNYTLNAH